VNQQSISAEDYKKELMSMFAVDGMDAELEGLLQLDLAGMYR